MIVAIGSVASSELIPIHQWKHAVRLENDLCSTTCGNGDVAIRSLGGDDETIIAIGDEPSPEGGAQDAGIRRTIFFSSRCRALAGIGGC